MSKVLKKINKKISSEKKQEDMEEVFKDAKKKLTTKYKVSPFGSFGKHLVTSKTKDIDIDVISNSESIVDACEEKKEIIKLLTEKYATNPSVSSSSIDIELKDKGITVSFTFKFKDNNSQYVKIKNLGKLCENGGKSHKKDLQGIFNESNTSKKQKWITRKFVKILKYQLSDANKGIPMYILEHSLTNKLLQSSNGVINKFEVYKDFLSDFSSGCLDTHFKGEIKNQDSFENIKGRAKNEYKKIKSVEWSNFSELF